MLQFVENKTHPPPDKKPSLDQYLCFLLDALHYCSAVVSYNTRLALGLPQH